MQGKYCRTCAIKTDYVPAALEYKPHFMNKMKNLLKKSISKMGLEKIKTAGYNWASSNKLFQ